MDYKGYKRHVLNSIVIDAFLAFKADTEVHYSRNRSGYNGCNHFGYMSVTKAIKFLCDARYIRDFRVPAVKPKKDDDNKNTTRSFFKPTQKLYDSFPNALEGWEAKTKPMKWATELTIRADKGCYISGLVSPKKRIKAKGKVFEAFNKELLAQNEFLAGFDIEFIPLKKNLISQNSTVCRYKTTNPNIPSDRKVRTINIAKVYQKQVFLKKKKDDEEFYAGRYYGGFWQSLYKGERKRIKINGESVAKEVDYKSLHPSIAYCLAGAEMPSDPYQGVCKISDKFGDKGTWRDICKIALLIAINAGTFKAAKGALSISLVEMFPAKYPEIKDDDNDRVRRRPARRDAKKILNAVIRFNEPIKNFIHSDYGIKFQRIDAEIMSNVQRRCRDHNIPILGVHDSFLFRKSDQSTAKKIIKEEYDNAIQRLRENGLSSFGME